MRFTLHAWPGLIVAALVLAGCQGGQPDEIRFTGATMGTSYAVTVAAPPAGLTEDKLQHAVDTALDAVDARMSTYRKDSELSRVNRAPGGQWVPVSPQLLKLLERARGISRLSHGAFDVTVGPLVNLWGFGPDTRPKNLPTDAQVASRKRLVGMDKLTLREKPPAVRKALGGMYVDLSAIAKGYGVDRVAQTLNRLGATRYLVEVGGELYGRGNNGQDKPWTVAIERPQSGGSRRVQDIARLHGAGMATSGDYRNFYVRNGKHYSHTIDPRTGRPVTHHLHSVTVIASSTARADGLATALLVLGPKQGRQLAREQHIAALFIVGHKGAYTDFMTQAFRPYLEDRQ